MGPLESNPEVEHVHSIRSFVYLFIFMYTSFFKSITGYVNPYTTLKLFLYNRFIIVCIYYIKTKISIYKKPRKRSANKQKFNKSKVPTRSPAVVQ